MNITLPGFGNFAFGLRDISLAGLNSWTVFTVINPLSNISLGAQLAMADFNLSCSFFLNVTFNSSEGIITGIPLFDQGRFVFAAVDNQLFSQVQVVLNAVNVEALSGTQFSDNACLRNAIMDLNMTELALNLTLRQLLLDAGILGLEQDLDQALTHFLALLTNSYEQAVPAFVTGVIAGPVRQKLNAWYSTLLAIPINESACQPAQTDDAIDTMTVVAPICGCLLLLALLILISHLTSKNAKKSTLLLDLTAGQARINGDDGKDNKCEEEVALLKPAVTHPALICDPSLKATYRYGIFGLIWLNVAMFIFANTNIIAKVHIVLTVNGTSQKFPSFYDFAEKSSIVDLWRAGCYALSLLIFITSGT